MTLSEHLYVQYMNADTPEKKHEYLCRLMGICLKAIGHLTPPWRGGWNRDFDSLRYKARMPWVFRWLEAELAKPQKDGARYIGRRCRNAIVDEIRRHKAEQRRLAKNGPADWVPVHRPDSIESRQELMAVLTLTMRYASDETALDVVEKGIAFDSILKLGPVKNVTVAKELQRSEGYVRKKKKSLYRKLIKAKWERIQHWEKEMLKAMKADYETWATLARADKAVWWDRQRDGKPFVISAKNKPVRNCTKTQNPANNSVIERGI